MIEEETKKVTVTEENIREVIQTILKHSNISDLDVYNDIFENREGHLPDAPENRKLLQDLANDSTKYKGKDKYGNDWNVRMNNDGTQDWVRSQHQVINEGGRNRTPRPWDKETGLFRNPTKRK